MNHSSAAVWENGTDRANRIWHLSPGVVRYGVIVNSTLTTLQVPSMKKSGNNEEYRIKPAERITRLPPYLFARINALKHAKRQEGADIIDLGMGNPMDGAPQTVVDQGSCRLRRASATEILPLFQVVGHLPELWHTACIFAHRTSPVCVPNVQPP